MVTQLPRPALVDLPIEGTGDWLVFNSTAAVDYGSTTVARKRLGGGQIAGVGYIGGGIRFANQADVTASSWTAADSLTNAPGSHAYHAGVYGQVGAGLRITVPAGTQPRRLRLYLSHYQTTAELRCRLSDGSLPDVVYTHVEAAATYALLLDVVFKASRDGQSMFVSWTYTNDHSGSNLGNVTLHAISLSVPMSN